MLRSLALALVLLLTAMPASAQDASDFEPIDAAQTPEGFDLQGHRGARGVAPENTIPAFRKALEIGVTTLEMDVVISGDGQVVVSHEPWMSATICRGPEGAPIGEDEAKEHNLFEMDYEQIARYDCGSRAHPRFPEQTLQPARKPLLRDVIEMAESYVEESGRAPVFYNVETKSRPSWDGTFTPEPEPFVRALYRALRETGVAARTTVQSFDPRTLEVLHRIDPNVRTAMLVGEEMDEGLRANLGRLSFTPDVYSPAYALVDAQMLDAARHIGETEKNHPLQVIPWTVNDEETMRRLIDLGVHGLITDYPNRAARFTRGKVKGSR